MRKIMVVLALAAGIGAATMANANVVRPYVASLFQATAPAGSNGFACLADGCRVDLGPGASDYWAASGGAITTPGAVAITGRVLTGGGLSFSGVTAIPTCSSTYEGEVRRLTGTGGTNTGARTRLCVCTSDGAASPAFAWVNVVSGTVGTTTACNP